MRPATQTTPATAYDAAAKRPDEMKAEAAELLPGSPDLRRINHATQGSWLSFRETLQPRYDVVWAEIAACIAMAAGGFAVHVALTAAKGNAFGFRIGWLFAIWIGFWLNAILTFGHEAAHYNLAASHARNDALADWTIWLFFPQTTRAYRRSHWQHHLHLGDTQDSEISYHNCLSPWFLAKTLTGIHLATLLLKYVFGRQAGKAAGTGRREVTPLARSLATHLIIVTTAILLRCYASAVVWLVSAGLIFPFFATIRQLLEHRGAEAACETNFDEVTHGPVNRMFGNDLFSRYFGAAGFNRHLLHHWDPTVSYTRFDEMHGFLSGTELKDRLEGANSSYLGTALLLFKKAIHGDQ